MAIQWPRVAEGTRVKVRQAEFPQDPLITGKTGTVVIASEYSTQMVAVTLDGSSDVRYFAPEELEITAEPALPPEIEAAKQRRALP